MRGEVPVDVVTRFSAQVINSCAEVFAQALSERTGSVWTCVQAEQNISLEPLPVGHLVSAQVTGTVTGEVIFLLTAQESQPLLAALRSGEQEAAEIWCVWLESLRNVLQRQLLSASCSIQLGECRPAPVPHFKRSLGCLSLTSGGAVSGRVVVGADAVLEASLKALADAEDVASQERLSSVLGKPKIERVIDVPLAVTLRFGERQLSLREVLALTTGSLVELDRQVEEPVDLVLGNRLIARGEVVIVDGNYGLRVTEVVEGTADRLSRLKGVHTVDETETHAR